MAKVIKVGKRFKVVHDITEVPVGTPNTFSKRGKALTRAIVIRRRIMGR